MTRMPRVAHFKSVRLSSCVSLWETKLHGLQGWSWRYEVPSRFRCSWTMAGYCNVTLITCRFVRVERSIKNPRYNHLPHRGMTGRAQSYRILDQSRYRQLQRQSQRLSRHMRRPAALVVSAGPPIATVEHYILGWHRLMGGEM